VFEARLASEPEEAARPFYVNGKLVMPVPGAVA
jgi:hypothetical protein